MGRKSKLTDKQWDAIGKRLVAGEKAAALAREFKVSPATISERFSKSTEKVKSVANQLVATEQALDDLSVSEQISAISLARKLRSMQEHLVGAGEFAASTAHKLHSLANMQLIKIDEVEPHKSTDVLKGIATLVKVGNDAGVIPSAFLAANKEAVKQVQKEEPVLPVKVLVQVEDASSPEPPAE
jgi:hypothetical protein